MIVTCWSCPAFFTAPPEGVSDAVRKLGWTWMREPNGLRHPVCPECPPP